MINYRKLTAALIAGTIVCFSVTGCTMPWDKTDVTQTQNTTESTDTSIEDLKTTAEDLSLEFEEEDLNASWNASECTSISLADQNSSVDGSGVTIDGSDITITSAGSYILSGTLIDGSIHINVAGKGTVRLILNGVDITSTSKAPIYVEDAKKVLVTLADQTTNTLTDSNRDTTDSEDYSAAFSSKADLVFNGTGTLQVKAGYRNGIKSSDDLKIVSGTYVIESKEDGMIGKDLLGVKNGTFQIQAGADGMKSTYDTDTSKGNIILKDGNYTITSVNDGIQAENILMIEDGQFEIKTGSGAESVTKKSGNQMKTTASTSDESSDSRKGLKSSNAIYIAGGEITINSEDDAIHTNGTVYYTSGKTTINAGDDGIHADQILQIEQGTIDIKNSYEGLEAGTITINGGNVSVVSSDDGINASVKSSDTTQENVASGNQFAPGNNMGGGSGNSNATLTINGGELYVDASGDGLDANGSVTINGGNVVVCGPTSDGDTAIDFDSECTFNGGTLMAFGSSGMLETPTSASNGACIMAAFSSTAGNTEFSLTDSSENQIMNYTPTKAYASAIVYSSDIKTGSTYSIKCGDATQDIAVNNAVTSSGTSGMGGAGGKGGFGNMGNGGQRGDMQQPPFGQNDQNGQSDQNNQNKPNRNGQAPDQMTPGQQNSEQQQSNQQNSNTF